MQYSYRKTSQNRDGTIGEQGEESTSFGPPDFILYALPIIVVIVVGILVALYYLAPGESEPEASEPESSEPEPAAEKPDAEAGVEKTPRSDSAVRFAEPADGKAVVAAATPATAPDYVYSNSK